MTYGTMATQLLALSIFLLTPIAGAAKNTAAAKGPQKVVGGGSWESSKDRQGKRDWQVQLDRHDDDSLTGEISVVGSPAVRGAKIEGRVEGDEIYGVLVGQDQQQVGTFTGRLRGDGAAGTYTFKNGDHGQWNWKGSVAEKLKGGDRASR